MFGELFSWNVPEAAFPIRSPLWWIVLIFPIPLSAFTLYTSRVPSSSLVEWESLSTSQIFGTYWNGKCHTYTCLKDGSTPEPGQTSEELLALKTSAPFGACQLVLHPQQGTRNKAWPKAGSLSYTSVLLPGWGTISFFFPPMTSTLVSPFLRLSHDLHLNLALISHLTRVECV